MARSADDRFDELVAARYRDLLRTAILLTGDRGRGEDLLQDALVRCYSAAVRGAEPESLEAYVRTSMLRLAGRWRRRLWHREVPTADPPDRAGGADDAVDRAAAVRAALMTLPLGQRAALVLRYLESRSEAETAALLGVSVGTVKSRTSRALAALRTSGVLAEELTRD